MRPKLLDEWIRNYKYLPVTLKKGIINLGNLVIKSFQNSNDGVVIE